MQFNIFSQVSNEINEFFSSSVHIAGNTGATNRGLRSAGRHDSTGYAHSQWNTLNKIEMYYNSQFESGRIDSEGQRKAFLNICAFRADVAAKQVDIDLKNLNYMKLLPI